MLIFKLNLSKAHQNDLLEELKRAHQKGDLPWVKRILAVLAFAEGQVIQAVAKMLRVTAEAVRQWIKRLLVGGVVGLRSKKSPGRPSKMTKEQRSELAAVIDHRC